MAAVLLIIMISRNRRGDVFRGGADHPLTNFEEVSQPMHGVHAQVAIGYRSGAVQGGSDSAIAQSRITGNHPGIAVRMAASGVQAG